MTVLKIPRLVIAGTSSGVGKTTIVTGLLAELRQRGWQVQSYKIGPDYIDPGFHRLASGRPAHNLDSWLMPPQELAMLFNRTAAGNDIAIIEGVMGLYDGGGDGMSSTAAIAKQLDAPVVLVVDARSAGESVAATVLGFKMYDPELNIVGVIVNRLGSAAHQSIVADALVKLAVPVLGCIRRNEALTIPERHLGLTPVTETDTSVTIAAMAKEISHSVAVDQLIAAACSAPPIEAAEPPPSMAGTRVRIGVAYDQGFSFYYSESLAGLEALGAELVPFSPLDDNHLPAVDGLIFGGGFPEMFLADLEANVAMREEVGLAAQRGMPIYAECGGLMYLAQQVVGFDGRTYRMTGLIPAVCRMQPRLQTVGYVTATALADNILCAAGEQLHGHEFHFSLMEVEDAEKFPWAFRFEKTRTGSVYPGGFARENILASYLHIHFAGSKTAAARFVDRCRDFQTSEA